MIFPCRVWPKSGLAGSVGELSQCTVMSEWLRLDSRFSSWLPTFRLRMPFCITCGSHAHVVVNGGVRTYRRAASS